MCQDIILIFLACSEVDKLEEDMQQRNPSEAEAEKDQRILEKDTYQAMKRFGPLCEELVRMDLDDDYDSSDEGENTDDNDIDEEPVEMANFVERSANEIEIVSEWAKIYKSTKEAEPEEDDNDANIDLEDFLRGPESHHHENNDGYEDDDNFLIENGDVVELSERKLKVKANANCEEHKDFLTNFYTRIPALEHVLRGAIKRCKTGLPRPNKEDKSDLFHKYKGIAYVIARGVRFIYTKHQLTEIPITGILRLMHAFMERRIPRDIRSIMHHSYEVSHYKLEKNIQCYDLPIEKLVKSMLIEYQSMGEELPKKLKIHFNADGVSVSKSSNAQLYVFLLGFPQLKWDPIVMCHLLDGTPDNQIYYKPTIKYLNKVQKYGIPDVLPNGETLRVEVEGGFFDRKSLSDALWIKAHSSTEGCPHCRIKGISLIGDGFDTQGRLPGCRKVNFYQNLPGLEDDWTEIIAARRNETARSRQENNIRHLDRSTPKPPIFNIFKEFDVVQQNPGDGMHQVYIGQKQLFQFIVTGEGASLEYNENERPRLGEVYLMQNRIKKCHSFVTRKLFHNRIPRPNFVENSQKYKAAEIRCLVLYCYPIALGVLRNEAIKRIGNTLFFVLRILENASLIERYLGTDDELKSFNWQLRELIEEYALLFGPQSITYNRHAWLHLAFWVKRFGPLSSWGCWRFENFNHHLTTFLHAGSRNKLQEACNRYLERCSTSHFLNWEKPKEFKTKYWLEEAKEVNIYQFFISS